MESRWRKHFIREKKSQASDYKKQANLSLKMLRKWRPRGTLEDGIRVFSLLIIVGPHVAFTTLEEPALQ